MTSRKIYIEFANMFGKYLMKYHPTNKKTKTQTLVALGSLIKDVEDILKNDNPNFNIDTFESHMKLTEIRNSN
tara:strand:+ start:163 stop:381 length:219 start_codon:yes stop_codon:yes gene_type:complete